MTKNIIRTSVYSSEDAKLMTEEQALVEMLRGNCYQYWKITDKKHLKTLKNHIRMFRLIFSQYPVRSAYSRLISENKADKNLVVQL